MSTTIFPVETATVAVTPATASTFEGTFLSGAVAAVAAGMSATIPQEITALVAICDSDFTERAAIYCVPNILVGFLGMQLAYRAGAVPIEDYFKYLVKNWKQPVIEQALVTWFETVKMETGMSGYFTQLPEAFVLKHPDMISDSGSTVLMFACFNKNTALALTILATGLSKPEHVNNGGNTAFIYACDRSLSDVALAILGTGLGKPEHINNNGDTALIWACDRGLSYVVVAILATGLGKPEHINNNGDTALICACDRGLSDVALAILKTGVGKPKQANNIGDTALTLATKHGLTNVVAELHRIGITK
jgi:hypothetical protein